MRPYLALCLPLAALAACSNANDGAGGSGGPATWAVAVTDAASDRLAAFEVEVTGLELIDGDDATVELLAEPVRLDLTALADLSQVVDVASVPAGVYTAARVTLDLDGAEVWIVGEPTAADLLDGDGVPRSGSLVLPIELARPVEASAAEDVLVEFDLDLDQSVQVDEDANAVFFEPVVLVRVDPSQQKELVLVGTGSEFSATQGTFRLRIETFDQVPVGEALVRVDGNTVYQVNGLATVGIAGLQALASQADGTWVQVYGGLVDGSFEASYVEAGTGTYNGGSDIVEGYVVQRLGGAGADAVLTVLGRSNDADHTSLQFNTLFTVQTGFATTRVARRGEALNGDTDDVNVGQRVRVFGSLAGTVLNATAVEAVLRLEPTWLSGFADGAPAGGELVMDLERVGLRLEESFQWSDGGSTPPDPEALVVEVGSQGSGLGGGDPVQVRGFFTAVDDPGVDFVADEVEDLSGAASLVFVSDRPEGWAVSATLAQDQVTLAVEGEAVAGELALLDQGLVGLGTLPDDPAPTVTGPELFGLYFLRDRDSGAVGLYLTFPAFLNAWQDALDDNAVLYNLTAIGPWDGDTNTLTAVLANLVVD